MKKRILVAGGNGQLGKCLQKLQEQYEDEFEFMFTDSGEMDITSEDQVEEIFESFRPGFCINASAYTAVDLAEKEPEKAYAINAEGVCNLAEACRKFNAVFIHVSTDYVFDGETEIPYDEDNFTSPLGVYGASKREGEIMALEANPHTIIVRTSWLYSEFNKNFVKTMLHLFEVKNELSVVDDQFGQPTNANDLAEAIMKMVRSSYLVYGIYHFSNYPETTWFQFAKKIAEFSGSSIQIHPITTDQYPTPAKRPHRSTMSLDKIEEIYRVVPRNWENSLEECIEILKETV